MGKDTAEKYNAIVAEYFDGDKDTRYVMQVRQRVMDCVTRFIDYPLHMQ